MSTMMDAADTTVADAPTTDVAQCRLFFIVGKSRSGTTLLQTMLDANPELAVAPECQFVMNMHHKYSAGPWSRKRILAFSDDLWRESHLRSWGLDREKLRADLLAIEDQASFANLCKQTYKSYAEAHGKGESLVFGDMNHHYSLFVDRLSHAFSDARFIHLVRDYRDNVLSHLSVTFETNSVSGLAYRWKTFNDHIQRHADALGDRLTLVRYEDLVTDPEPVMRRLCGFLGVEFHEDMLQHQKNRRATFDDVWQPNLRNPVNANRVQAWRSELRPRDIARCELICGESAQRYGYESTTDAANAFSIGLRLSTLPGVVAAWVRTALERRVFSLPIGLSSLAIKVARAMNKTSWKG